MVIDQLSEGKNIIEEDSIVTFQNDVLDGIAVLLAGDVSFYISKDDDFKNRDALIPNSLKLFSLPKNSFFCVADMFRDKPSFFSVVASANSKILKVPLLDKDKMRSYFIGKDTYNVFLLQSLSDAIVGINNTKIKLQNILKDLTTKKENLTLTFWKFKSMANVAVKPQTDYFVDAEKIFEKYNHEMPVEFDNLFLDRDNSYMFTGGEKPKNKNEQVDFSAKIKSLAGIPNTRDYTDEIEELKFFIEFAALDLAKKKVFILSNLRMSLHLSAMASSFIEVSIDETKTLIREIFETLDSIASLGQESLFTLFTSATLELKKNSSDKYSDFYNSSKFIFDYISSIDEKLKMEVEHSLSYYLEDMHYTMNNISLGGAAASEDGEKSLDGLNIDVIAGSENLPPDIQNSLSKIIAFSDIEKSDADAFNAAMSEFRKTKDKFDTEDEMRKLRRSISVIFFKIYKNIMLKSVKESNLDRLYTMFLDYGFTDERLLEDEQSLALYRLSDKTESSIRIYSMSEWAKAVYEKEADPSFNDFGQFYREAIRELVKRGSISKQESEDYMESGHKRLDYEVDNMIKSTNRLCYGQLSVYVPMLHKDMIVTDLTSSFMTKEKLGSIIESLLGIDFSIFYREVLYKNPEFNIEKEIIMKEVLPMFILSPTFGSRAIMWQELESTNKSTAGRMIMPAFTNENIEEMVIKIFGAFRWELCKNMLGPLWSDISQSSLTAYYSDYVQFYKKNRDLSDEAKEKIKKQMAKSRNNLKDFFVSDYFMWINFEAKGVMRLNKAARQILYRFVPFSRELRDELSKLPMFADDANRFKNIRSKQATEVKNKLHKYTKDGGELPPDLARHLEFYSDM